MGKGDNPQPPPPVDRWISLSIHGPSPSDVTIQFAPDLHPAFGPTEIVDNHFEFLVPAHVTGGANLNITAPGYEIYINRLMKNGIDIPIPTFDEELDAVHLIKVVPVHRLGSVRPINTLSVTDDTGQFFPLGATLFWALWGWKFDRARLQENVKWLQSYGFDYIRILGEVDWAGHEIKPEWPDYEQLLGEMADWCYKECGIRIQIVVIGGKNAPLMTAARKVVNVTRGREDAIIMLEAVNEYNNHGKASAQEVIAMTEILKGSDVRLIAPSANSTNELMKHSNVWLIHTERKYADEGWRQVRQGWDFKSVGYVSSNNEPPGPLASADGDNRSPLQLTMMRALSIMCGASFYVLHNAAGVFGYVNGNRPANLWEVPGIDAINKAVRGIDKLLPLGVENWTQVNDGWNPPNPTHPLEADSHWEGSTGRGVNKNYGAKRGRQFISMPIGIRGFVNLTARAPMMINVYNPLTLELVHERTMSTNDVIKLDGRNDTMVAYIIRGEML